MSERGHCPGNARVEVGVFFPGGEGDPPRRSRQKAAYRRCMSPSPGDVTGAAWGPARALCTFVAFQHYPFQPYICPARGWDTCSSPTPVLAGLSNPRGLWGEGKLQVMLLAGQQERGLTWAGQHDLAPFFSEAQSKFF